MRAAILAPLLLAACQIAPLDEHVFSAEDFRVAGSFQPVVEDGRRFVRTDAGVDPPQNFVEVSFPAAAGRPYRCFAFVGGCCAERMSFFVQASELGRSDPCDPMNRKAIEPGSNLAVPVVPGGLGLKRTHASHGGTVPILWEWIEVPLPERYASAGTKIVRLLSDERDFSVASVLVTSRGTVPKAEPVVEPPPKVPDGPADLLAEADRLWETDSTAAIRIYKRLLADHADTAAVKGARSRILRRAEQED